VRRVLLSSLFLWTGILLLVIPWSDFWEQNYFARALPAVLAVISNNYVRGAVSGLGVINIYLGVAELVAAITARPSHTSALGSSSISSRE